MPLRRLHNNHYVTCLMEHLMRGQQNAIDSRLAGTVESQ